MMAWEAHRPSLPLWETKPVKGVQPKRILAAQITALDLTNYQSLAKLSLIAPDGNRDFVMVGKGFMREFLPQVGGYFLMMEDGSLRGYLGPHLFEKCYQQVKFDGVDIDAIHKGQT